jgi:hypothetical protein
MVHPMRIIALVTVSASLLLAACAGYSPECVTGTGTKDCAAGTMGHQQMVQQQQGEETVASIDDARCRAYAVPGSREYLACRQRASSARSTGR